MPITYVCEPESALLRTRCSGNVTLEDVISHFRDLDRNPALPARLDVFLDLTEMDSIPESAQLRTVAKQVEQLQQKVTWGVWAIVASSDALYGMSRVFEVFAGDNVANSRVFRNLAEAEIWLTAARPRPMTP